MNEFVGKVITESTLTGSQKKGLLKDSMGLRILKLMVMDAYIRPARLPEQIVSGILC
jgi:hypothetical protein